MTQFFGRKKELETLTDLFKKGSASLVVVQGRRRIGKSRLVVEFAKNYRFYSFSGLPPVEETTAQSQRDDFSRQLNTQTGLPEVKADDWSKLFLLLAEKTKSEQIVVLLDEISWIGSKDPDFLGKLKTAWDQNFAQNPKLIMILCGSVSPWIEENILSSTGFVGRLSCQITLGELPLAECNKFWGKLGDHISAQEKFKVLAVIGGVPRYLEEIKPSKTAEQNIKDLCFAPSGALVNEFNNIFSDLFSKRSGTYKKIIEVLAQAPLEIKDICKKLKIAQTGFISEYLEDLVKSGFITRDFTWKLEAEEASKLSQFRLSDNYLRFYLRYMDKNISKIKAGDYAFKSLALLPNWESIMGLQFENLVLKNKSYIKEHLGIKQDEVVSDNPFFQRKTNRLSGCQVDYLIQTKFSALYVCEIKFSRYPIDNTIIAEMQNKIKALYYPKGFSCRPVLIHINGVKEEVVTSGFFADIIDFSELLTESS
jgi:AAA+ ATPase superfamily predicted ATPase